MIVKTEARLLGALWDSLRDQRSRARGAALDRQISAIVARGWADRCQVEDLLLDMGGGWFWGQADVNALFGIPRQTVFARPRARSNGVMGFDETSAADLAYILIQIERLGLGIDPSPLVEALRSSMLKRPVLTRSELHVLWYAKERHKMEPVTVEAASALVCLGSERVVLSTGYKVDLWRDKAGEVGSITVKAPKHRRMRVAA